jgi:predicted SnoaL-like aldol condensation-catalyzing enzyme
VTDQTHQAFVEKYFSDGVPRLLRNDRQAIEEYFTQDYVDHTAHTHMEAGGGRDGVAEGLAYAGERTSEVNLVPDMTASDGDLLFIHWHVDVTHNSPWKVRHVGEVELQGNQVQTAGVTIFRMRDGKIAESWQYDNHYDVLLETGQIQINTPAANATS